MIGKDDLDDSISFSMILFTVFGHSAKLVGLPRDIQAIHALQRGNTPLFVKPSNPIISVCGTVLGGQEFHVTMTSCAANPGIGRASCDWGMQQCSCGRRDKKKDEGLLEQTTPMGVAILCLSNI